MEVKANLPRRSDGEFRETAAMSQILSELDKDYKELAGSDPSVSDSIGFLLVLGRFDLIDLDDPSIKLMLELLHIQRKSHFATSDKTNEITKMGLQMPKRSREVNMSERR